MTAPSAPIDPDILQQFAGRLRSHPLVVSVSEERSGGTLTLVCATFDSSQYPDHVETARLELQWYQNGDYNFHYLESHLSDTWQCRWDRHPNPHTDRTHFHPPPAARSNDAVPDSPTDSHPSALVTRTLAAIRSRIQELWQ